MGRITLAGLPPTKTMGGTSRVTTLPGPITEPSPMVKSRDERRVRNENDEVVVEEAMDSEEAIEEEVESVKEGE